MQGGTAAGLASKWTGNRTVSSVIIMAPAGAASKSMALAGAFGYNWRKVGITI